MTIRKGESWGESVAVSGLGSDLVVVHRDAEAAALVCAARATDTPVPTLGLAAGDVARTLGGGAAGRFDPTEGATVVRAPVDLLHIEAEGRTTTALAHIVARSPRWSWWRDRVVFVMNAQFLGRYDIAPRSHPNDGKADIVQVHAGMDLRTRLQAARRARTGTHVPHPQISVQQSAAVALEFERPLALYVDGEKWCTTRRCAISVEPDAVIVHA